jgi:hypothetical protein
MFGVNAPEPAPAARENALFSSTFVRADPRQPEKCSDNLMPYLLKFSDYFP